MTTHTEFIIDGRNGVQMIQESWQFDSERTLSGLDWHHAESLNSGDAVTVTDPEGTYIAEVYDVSPELGQVYIDLR